MIPALLVVRLVTDGEKYPQPPNALTPITPEADH